MDNGAPSLLYLSIWENQSSMNQGKNSPSRQPHLQDLSPLQDSYNIFNLDLVAQ